jgi:hypothetical protein
VDEPAVAVGAHEVDAGIRRAAASTVGPQVDDRVAVLGPTERLSNVAGPSKQVPTRTFADRSPARME